MIDETWLTAAVSASVASPTDTAAVVRLRDCCGTAPWSSIARRDDVVSPDMVWPRRGLLHDEAASFLRAVDTGIALVDDAGYVTLPTVRPKRPEGRYALLAKSGNGVSVNLEYLIQIGATAELILDHGWTPDSIDFERGEFDALGSDPGGRVVLAMEAKARVAGSDSLETMLRVWLRAAHDSQLDLNTNAGRKYRELWNLCASGPITVWLVADGARWTLTAQQTNAGLTFRSADVLTMPSSHEPVPPTSR